MRHHSIPTFGSEVTDPVSVFCRRPPWYHPMVCTYFDVNQSCTVISNDGIAKKMVSDPETETGLVLAAGGIMSTFEFWNVDKIP